ncbi:RNA polymerase sigma factor [Curtobacterium sp. Leaf261]|uniref:RNA polymerase sigma factor n=1 Tax=Curtobacterium sp. Leaf261 TaxID=1736311 RepID=UPI0006F50264|nr:RNA polymerase sigma factor [Curtobacterium sp. Leaf261]KQO61252.1 hypothetical protein ASF23_12220 [Curtobacterium sp. Leaf261]
MPREPLDHIADVVLVGRAADGDTAAFGVVVRRHGPLMRAYVARILGNEADADDVVQEAVLQAWQRIDSLADAANVRAWLFRIAANKAFDRLRRRHPHDDLTDVADLEHPVASRPDHVVAVRMQVEEVARIVQELPDAQRAVWVMREVGGASYADIAEQTGMPAATVRGMLARARRRVMDRMEGWR